MTTCQLLDPPPPVCGCLDGLSLADAIRAGFKAVGLETRPVLDYLAAHGRTGIPARRVCDVRRRDLSPAVIPGGTLASTMAALRAAGSLIPGRRVS